MASISSKHSIRVDEHSETASSSDEMSVSSKVSQSNDVSKEEPEKGSFAFALKSILAQEVKGKVPVLAKRKTEAMVDMEEQRREADRLKRLRKEKKAEREKQLTIPDFGTENYERQLKKLANRGVVALFNAIAKAKREDQETDNQAAPSKVTRKKNSRKDIAAAVKEESKRNLQKMSGNDDTTHSITKKKDTANNEKKWSVLQEESLTSKRLGVKDWDKDDTSDDEM